MSPFISFLIHACSGLVLLPSCIIPYSKRLVIKRRIHEASLSLRFTLELDIEIYRSANRDCACGHDRHNLIVDQVGLQVQSPDGDDVYPPSFSDIWGRSGKAC